MTVVFYISGHGFGHASRVVEVVNALGTLAPGARLVIGTSAPRWLFDLTVTVPFEFRAIEPDTGIVQRDSLSHDIPETLRRAAAFYASFDERVAREAEFLRTLPRLPLGGSVSEGGRATGEEASGPGARGRESDLSVVGDIPPLAFAAAARAGAPSAALGNFTWDWIYEDYLSIGRSGERIIGSSSRGRSGDRWIVDRIAHAYSQAREGWRLPMHGGFASFDRVTDVPFIARHSRREPEETRRAFGIPLDRPVVLSSFGGYGLNGLPLDRVDCLDEYAIVVTDTSVGQAPAVRRASPEPSPQSRHMGAAVIALRESAIYDAGFRYEDLVRSADVVLTKPGYGIIAECLANGTALVYTSRGRFREYDVLVAAMPAFLRCAFIEREDLFAGRWRAALETAMAQPAPAVKPRTDGAADVARRIQGLHG